MERAKLDADHEHGRLTTTDHDRISAFLDGRDETCLDVPSKGVKTTDSGHSLRSYCNTLRTIAKRLDTDGLADPDTTADVVNGLMGAHLSGDHPDVKDGGLSNRTISSYQGIVRKFYDYHDDLGVPHTAIEVVNPDRTPVDDRDIFDKEEIEAMRDAIENTRDRALFEILVNTGQRIGAVQSLRVSDMDPDNGVFYLNGDADGLKGADDNGLKRPLLGAKRAVHDWLRDHPTGDPDDYFITHLPTWSRSDPGARMSQQSINRLLKAIAERAGIRDPRDRTHAHTFRHTFVTVAKKDYNLDDSTIKHLIGHAADSKVMETTYQHLTADDHIQAAEEGAGLREPAEESTLTPPACLTCGEPLGDGAKACAACGTVYAPDAQAVQDDVDHDIKQSYAETHPEDDDTQAVIDAIDRAAEDPELKAALLERLS